MKLSFLICMMACLVAGPVFAETLYVNDVRYVMLRSGPGLGYKVLDQVPSGAMVEARDEKDGWTLARLPESNTQGWVLSRFLTPQEPATRIVDQAVKRASTALARAQSLEITLTRISAENKQLALELVRAKQQAKQWKDKYSQLYAASRDVMGAKAAKRGFEHMRERLDATQRELAYLRNRTGLAWFFGGAGVLLFGIILGSMLRPAHHRRSNRLRIR